MTEATSPTLRSKIRDRPGVRNLRSSTPPTMISRIQPESWQAGLMDLGGQLYLLRQSLYFRMHRTGREGALFFGSRKNHIWARIRRVVGQDLDRCPKSGNTLSEKK